MLLLCPLSCQFFPMNEGWKTEEGYRDGRSSPRVIDSKIKLDSKSHSGRHLGLRMEKRLREECFVKGSLGRKRRNQS